MKSILFVIALLVITPAALAQDDSPATAFGSGDYARSVELADSILSANPDDAMANFYKGASFQRLERNEEAIAFLERAGALGYQPGNAVLLNLARAFLGLGQNSQALDQLESLANGGFGAIGLLQGTAFRALDGHPRFVRIKESVQRNARPCQFSEDSKRLDFWLGEWDVYAAGAQIAESVISKSVDGCTLHEDYRTFGGYSGSSLNYFDPADGLYRQVWIDSQNAITLYAESSRDDNFLELHANQANGTELRMNYRYDPDTDTVVQAVDSSSDGGETWTNGFLGTYRRRAGAAAAIRAALDEMERLFAANSMEQIAGIYTDDAQIFEPGGGIVAGSDAIGDYWRALDGKGESWTLNIEEIIESDQNAYAVVTSTLVYEHEGQSVIAKTRAMITWKKGPGGYRIQQDFFQVVR